MIIDKDKITEAKEKLGIKNAEIIANELNLENYDNKNMKACCPYHAEKTPSFIYNNKNHNFHCFGCSVNVDIIDVFMQKGNTYIEATEKLFDLADIPHTFGEKNVKTKSAYRYPVPVESTDKTNVYKYLETRGISKEIVDYCDVREDKNGNVVEFTLMTNAGNLERESIGVMIKEDLADLFDTLLNK